jgi:hypothetical protein
LHHFPIDQYLPQTKGPEKRGRLIGGKEKNGPKTLASSQGKRPCTGEYETFSQLLERNPEFLKTDLATDRIIDYKELLA